jgi:hypothetical protein
MVEFQRIWFTNDFFDYYLHTDEAPFIVYETDFSKRAMVLMIRDPQDAVVSMYHWLVTRKGSVSEEYRSIDAFAWSSRYGIERASGLHFATAMMCNSAVRSTGRSDGPTLGWRSAGRRSEKLLEHRLLATP